MKFIKKEQLNNFFSGCKGCFLALAKHPFVSCFVLFVLALIISSLLYYCYGFLAEKKEVRFSGSSFELEEKDYQEVLEVWEEKEDSFERASEKDYPNLFEQFPED